MSFLSVIGKGIKTVVTAIGHGFAAVFGANGEQAVKDFAAAEVELLKTDAGQVALQVVETLETTGLTSASKRTAAAAQITAELAKEGISAGEATVNLLIELAVNVVKGHVTVAQAAGISDDPTETDKHQAAPNSAQEQGATESLDG